MEKGIGRWRWNKLDLVRESENWNGDEDRFGGVYVWTSIRVVGECSRKWGGRLRPSSAVG